MIARDDRRDSRGSALDEVCAAFVDRAAVCGRSAWTITRNPDGSVASLSKLGQTVAVLRDVEGDISGIDETTPAEVQPEPRIRCVP